MIALLVTSSMKRTLTFTLPVACLCAATFLLAQEPAQNEASVKPGINDEFLKPDLLVEDWIGRFEIESREVYHCRDQIVSLLDIKPGMAVADIGAGTGLYMQPFAEAVGQQGRVYAVDISEAFVHHLERRAKKLELDQVEVVRCAEDSVNLPEASIDLAFICDTYHHFEFPKSTLASLHRALKPGGRVALIDFERIPGVSREWILGHVRAGKDVFGQEIAAAGFEKVKELTLAGLKENYFVIFRKAQ